MKKVLTTNFQTRLWDTVKGIEQNSQVEVVVQMRSHSADYRAIPLIWGSIAALLSHTYVIFAPDLFPDWLVYTAPLIAFTISFWLGHFPLMIRSSVSNAVLQRNVEIMARALFQKGGVHHTQAKIGLLIYCSFLEKTVYFVADRGLLTAIPATDWQALQSGFQQIFAHQQPGEALLARLQQAQPLFSRYLPIQANDINELPDVMDIDL